MAEGSCSARSDLSPLTVAREAQRTDAQKGGRRLRQCCEHGFMRVDRDATPTCAGRGWYSAGTEAHSRLYTRFSGFFPGAFIFLGICCWRV